MLHTIRAEYKGKHPVIGKYSGTIRIRISDDPGNVPLYIAEAAMNRPEQTSRSLDFVYDPRIRGSTDSIDDYWKFADLLPLRILVERAANDEKINIKSRKKIEKLMEKIEQCSPKELKRAA